MPPWNGGKEGRKGSPSSVLLHVWLFPHSPLCPARLQSGWSRAEPTTFCRDTEGGCGSPNQSIFSCPLAYLNEEAWTQQRVVPGTLRQCEFPRAAGTNRDFILAGASPGMSMRWEGELRKGSGSKPARSKPKLYWKLRFPVL